MPHVRNSRPVALVAGVEDRALVRRLEENRLEAVGGAQSLDELAARAWNAGADIILLPQRLPEMTGVEACRRLYADPRVGRRIPIVVLAADTPSPEQRVASLRAGVWDFLRYPDESDEFSLKLQTYLQVKRNMDALVEEGLVDLGTGLYTLSGLARRARELGALMYREHGALSCLVFGVPADVPALDAGTRLAGAARVSDAVGWLTPSEVAVVAPVTDRPKALRLAQRLTSALRDPFHGPVVPVAGASVLVGYEAVANVRYSPVDPVALLARAAQALRSGMPEPSHPWISRFDPGVAAASGR